MVIDFVNQGPRKFKKYKKTFNKYYVKTFEELNLKGEFFTDVTIVDNKTIQEINRDYRKIDRPTDVISFAFLDEQSEKDLKGGPVSLGQIIISYEKAVEQAKEYKHSLKREINFLFVHGLLHLLGYDHTISKKEEEIMFSLQDKILGGLK